jgi:hypothetical protein
MTAVETARAALGAAGFTLLEEEAGGLAFHRPDVRGRLDELPVGGARLWWEVSPAPTGPMALACLAARVWPEARLGLRRGALVVEEIPGAAELPAALRRILDSRLPEPGPLPPVVDLPIGVFATAVPALAGRTFLRLAPETAGLAADAQATYVLLANTALRAGAAGWLGGPGLAVDPARLDGAALGEEVHALGHGLRALADASLARCYLDICGRHPTTEPRVPIRDASHERGETA